MDLLWWIIIAVVVVAVVGTVLGVMLSGNKSALASSYGGVVAIDALYTVDLKNNQSYVNSGDEMQLQYIGRGNGDVKWEYGIANTFTTIVEKTNVKVFRWIVPTTIFGNLVFRCTSVNNLAVRATSPPIVVSPVVTWHGVGDALHALQSDQTARFTYTDGGHWIQEGGVTLLLGGEIDNFKTFKPVAAKDIKVDVSSKTLTWHVGSELDGLFKLRFVTNNLVKQGYPTELQYNMAHEFSISAQHGFSTSGALCVIVIASAATGHSSRFAPGEQVLLQFTQFAGTVAGHDWYYSDTGRSWTLIATNDQGTTYNWTIPATLNGTVYIRTVITGQPVTVTDTSEFAQTLFTAGVFLTILGDSPSKQPIVNYQGQTSSLVSQVRVYVTGVDQKNIAQLNDRTNWYVGWLNHPAEVGVTNRAFRCPVSSVVATMGQPFPPNIALVDLVYVDNGYQLGPVTLPLFVNLSLNGTVTVDVASQAQYQLQP